MTERQRLIRERGLAKAREMAKDYKITSKERDYTGLMIWTVLITMTIAIIQSLIILL
jgi:hypothetical protein